MRLSRHKLAQYAADQLLDGNTAVLRQIAAYLIEQQRTHEADLLVRDIESQLAQRGELVARAATAHPIDAQQLTTALASLTGAQTVHVELIHDPSLIAGIKIDLPDSRLDTTVKRKLTALRSKA